LDDIPDTIFVLLSDLHFGDGLLAEARLPPLGYDDRLRIFGRGGALQGFVEKRCASHDYGVVAMLPLYLNQLFVQYREKGYARDHFDLFIVLGDQVTWPTQRAFRFVRDYLSRESCRWREGGLEASCSALHLKPETLIVVPGNHDKLLRPDLTDHHALLGALHLPPEPLATGWKLVAKRFGAREFLFVIVDANVYIQDDPDTVDVDSREHLARGVIRPGLGAEMRTALDTIRPNQRIDDVELMRPDEATVVLLVHFAVEIARLRGHRGSLGEMVVPHECEGLADLVDELRDKIHLVIHGHMHVADLYRRSGVPVVSVASTSQLGADNGFFLLKGYPDGELRAEHHVWKGRGFVIDSDPNLDRPLFRLGPP
jgi:predicted phosphodiesterase